jgi:PAS domain S-box-containing protein
MKKIFTYLNPLSHLGDKHYSTLYPFILTTIIYVISEIFAYFIAQDPLVVSAYIIYVPIILAVYLAFRFGIQGGIIVSILTVLYYLYIIYTRKYSGEQLISGIELTIILGFVFAAIGVTIGWLKQTIDSLIINESDERRRLQVILHQLPVGIIITNSKGHVTHVNKRVASIFGKKIPIGTSVGKDTFVDYEEKGKIVSTSQTPLYQIIHSGKQLVEREYAIRLPGGKKRHIQVNASTIRNKNEKVIAAASIISDITAQKELEERKDDFVNMASHELKTPLTSLKLYIDGLGLRIKGLEDKKIHKTLNGIKQQADRLQDLVNSLLDVSRLQTGKLNFNMEAFRIDVLVREALDELQGAVQSEKKIVYKGKIPLFVYGDKFRVHQVLTNLLTNAVKYSPDDKDIYVSVKRAKNVAVVGVRDYGIGIAKEQQKKIFDRLYQVTDPTVKTYPGLGMGLYISREIIKRHKGRIWVESEGDGRKLPMSKRGSTFYFTLPISRNSV